MISAFPVRDQDRNLLTALHQLAQEKLGDAAQCDERLVIHGLLRVGSEDGSQELRGGAGGGAVLTGNSLSSAVGHQ
jgi:hypothetical protein